MGVWPTYGAIKIERGKISKKARGGAKAKGSLNTREHEFWCPDATWPRQNVPRFRRL